jgi:hypothetical protein
MKATPAVLVTALCASLLAIVSAGPAHAEPREVHCAIQVVPLGEEPITSEPVCFRTPEEVDAYLGSAAKAALGTLASVALGTVYKDANYSGSSATYWGSSGCNGVTFGYPTLAAEWSGSISSVRGFNNCWVTLYSGTSYGGTKLTCTPDCSGIGSLNDATRSLVFRPSGTWG